ncbi:MAG: serine hydroxymethyltransferase [Pseudomonadota bacterium]
MRVHKTLHDFDSEIAQALGNELKRQQNQLEMIASENFASINVMAATGSVMTNKYAEGYPGRRYYGGCEFVDVAERLAIERACQLFGCGFANVQPHSGAQANEAVFLATMQPGDTFLGMALDCGGHLTHGSKVNMSGKWFNAVGYGVLEDGYIDMQDVAEKARVHKPKLIIAGGSAYARIVDFKAFRAIAGEVGALLMVDMAHFAGLVAGGIYPSPFPHAHIVTSTTHKTLRGPRGGFILTDDPVWAKKLNSAVFPGNQGGPLMHVIAAKAVGFKEALQPSFKEYAQNIVVNAKALADSLLDNDISLVTGGTDTHLLLVDLSSFGITGNDAEQTLERAGITCNKNGIPQDPLPPLKTSGIRLGVAATTTRGLGVGEFKQIGRWVAEVLNALQNGTSDEVEKRIRADVQKMCQRFPIPGYGDAEG